MSKWVFNPFTGTFDSMVSTAAEVAVVDADGNYTATDVEAALEEVMDKVTPYTYTASTLTVSVGTLTTGSVTSLYTIDDGNVARVTEIGGAPPSGGYDVQVDFSGINPSHIPNKIQGHISYNGNTAHTVRLQIWNYTGTPAWDNVTTIPNDGGTLTWYSVDVPGNITDYVSAGAAKLRFYHESTGVAGHVLSLDYVVLKDDTSGGGGVTEHGALTGLGDDDHPQYKQYALLVG